MNGIDQSLTAFLLVSVLMSGCSPAKKDSEIGGDAGLSVARERGDFGICKHAMLKMTRDPNTTHIPKVRGTETAESLTFEWTDENRIRLQDQAGNERLVSGRCALSKDSKQVAYLLLNDVLVH